MLREATIEQKQQRIRNHRDFMCKERAKKEQSDKDERKYYLISRKVKFAAFEKKMYCN